MLASGSFLAAAPAAVASDAVASDAAVRSAARALRADPVYVDPVMRAQFSKAGERALERRIEHGDRAVFVAVLPGGGPAGRLLDELRSSTGIAGIYAVRLGDTLHARADARVLPAATVRHAVSAVRAQSLPRQLDSFVRLTLRSARGSAPASWGLGERSDDGPLVPALIGSAAFVLALAGTLTVLRRRRVRRERARADVLGRLRAAAGEDLAAFTEQLEGLDFHPAEPGADDTRRADHERALDALDQARSLLAAVLAPADLRGVTRALAEGGHSLATLRARRAGVPVPDRRPPCFFDPAHGASDRDVTWAPPGAAPRPVPVCAADAALLRAGGTPAARTVPTALGRRPYWEADPLWWGPWATGWYGEDLAAALLTGTPLAAGLPHHAPA
ncbi:membrane protein [Streptomyces sp. SPB074]|nr:membrane protein [Streptomyces sp. SPB074]